MQLIEKHCSELLIHAADVEGLCQGIDEELVQRLGEWVTVPCTYAGGAKGQSQYRSQCHHRLRLDCTSLIPIPDISDLELVDKLSNGRVDLTFGS